MCLGVRVGSGEGVFVGGSGDGLSVGMGVFDGLGVGSFGVSVKVGSGRSVGRDVSVGVTLMRVGGGVVVGGMGVGEGGGCVAAPPESVGRAVGAKVADGGGVTVLVRAGRRVGEAV